MVFESPHDERSTHCGVPCLHERVGVDIPSARSKPFEVALVSRREHLQQQQQQHETAATRLGDKNNTQGPAADQLHEAQGVPRNDLSRQCHIRRQRPRQRQRKSRQSGYFFGYIYWPMHRVNANTFSLGPFFRPPPRSLLANYVPSGRQLPSPSSCAAIHHRQFVLSHLRRCQYRC